MSYSLLDRFRGAWLGAVVGHMSDRATIVLRDRNQPTQTKKNQTFFSDNIQKLWFEWSTREIVSMIQKPKLADLPWEQDSKVDFRPSTIILWLLPVILYHHDDWFSLSNFLHRRKGQQFSEEIDNILVWCYTIRLALRGELFLGGLAHRVVLGTQLKPTSIEWLKKVEVSCLKGFDSTQLIEELLPMKNREIPLSLFCFLNNPQDFWLTTQQALSLERQAANVTALSAALSGAYNGITAIPANWRILAQQDGFYEEIMIKTEEMIKEWLGIDLLIDSKTVPSVITASKVLQSRSGLRIVSQQEYGD